MAIEIKEMDLLDLAEMVGMHDYPLWQGSERRITDSDIAEALDRGATLEPDEARDPNTPMAAEDHARRVAWLVVNGQLERTVVTVKNGSLVDGNHRFAACLFAGVEQIRVCLQS